MKNLIFVSRVSNTKTELKILFNVLRKSTIIYLNELSKKSRGLNFTINLSIKTS